MISVDRIRYNKYSSKDFGLITSLSFDDDSGDTDTFLGRDAVASESYRGDFKRIHSYKYNDVMKAKITFIKETFEDFTMEEQRRILKWLTSKDTASFLTVYHDDSNVISYEILGGFIEVNTHKMGNGRVVGITATFESVSPWAFSPLHTIEKDVSAPTDNTIQLNVETDDPQSAIYPRITIKHGNSVIVKVNRKMIIGNTWIDDDWIDGTIYYYESIGEYYYNKHNEDGSIIPTATTTEPSSTTTSVVIKNTYADKNVFDLRIANNTSGETIVVDGANKVISSSRTRIFGDDFINWNWLPLYDGMNSISVEGNCTVTIEWREPIKCGDF